MIYTFGLTDGVLSFQSYLSFLGYDPENLKVYESITPISYKDLLLKNKHRFFNGTYIFTD